MSTSKKSVMPEKIMHSVSLHSAVSEFDSHLDNVRLKNVHVMFSSIFKEVLLLIKLIFFLFALIFPFQLRADQIILQCQANGKYDNEKFDPASVVISINQLQDYLTIDVQGPLDYRHTFSSRSFENNGTYVKRYDQSSENSFVIRQKITYRDSNSSIDQTISISRTTGILNINSIYVAPSGNTRYINISGNCNKVSEKNKF